ncbi:MAG TPA: iron-containing alcohol dehydrogenase [Gaiellaceae bacterium]|nr:iron-containing alcohol dehydrogenase [Gaiellaceae bacterium]
MIVRWGLGELPALAGERPFVVASPRWRHVLPEAERWEEVPSDRTEVPAGVEVVVAVGGGSAIDTAKAASAATGIPVVSVPTTYSGAEWTGFFGVRDRDRRLRGGGAGARLHAVVYEPELTVDLPRAETVGTALNALAHCAEALYAEGHNAAADREALAGATLIATWLPQVVERPRDLLARTELLRGACHAGAALAGSMLALGHAMAQALGGRYGLPHGAMNALCLPPALRYNAAVAPDAVTCFGHAIGADDAAAGVEELARLGGFGRLRDYGVPEEELEEVAAAVVERAGAKANPRHPEPAAVAELLRSIW